MIANIPVGTEFAICSVSFKGKRILDTGVVVGHTKSGNIKLQTKSGRKLNTTYHFQKLDKSSNFEIAGKFRQFAEFI